MLVLGIFECTAALPPRKITLGIFECTAALPRKITLGKMRHEKVPFGFHSQKLETASLGKGDRHATVEPLRRCARSMSHCML